MARTFHTGTIKKTTRVMAPRDRVWRRVGNIFGLPSWVAGVKETVCTSRKRSGIGATRLITFDDGSKVEEHVVAWEPGSQFTYVATEGLPLRAYVATISVRPTSRDTAEVTWQSYLNSEKMSEKEFEDFLAFMGSFYEASLGNLKTLLER